MCTWQEFQSPVTIQLESGADPGGMPQPVHGRLQDFFSGGDEARRTEMEWRWWFVDGVKGVPTADWVQRIQTGKIHCDVKLLCGSD